MHVHVKHEINWIINMQVYLFGHATVQKKQKKNKALSKFHRTL